jgi:hypothetical protein
VTTTVEVTVEAATTEVTAEVTAKPEGTSHDLGFSASSSALKVKQEASGK